MLAHIAERIGDWFVNKEQGGPTSSADVCACLYMRLLKRCLTRNLFPDQRYECGTSARTAPYSKELRQNGKDWPTEADTMVGMKRLDNVHDCCGPPSASQSRVILLRLGSGAVAAAL
jgi:hypothetical protein